MRAGGLGYENWVKEVVGGVGSGLFCLHLKSTCTEEQFTFSRHWLTLEGSVFKAPVVKASNKQKRHG